MPKSSKRGEKMSGEPWPLQPPPPSCGPDGSDGDFAGVDRGSALLKQLERILESDALVNELGFVHPTQLAELNAQSEMAASSNTIQAKGDIMDESMPGGDSLKKKLALRSFYAALTASSVGPSADKPSTCCSEPSPEVDEAPSAADLRWGRKQVPSQLLLLERSGRNPDHHQCLQTPQPGLPRPRCPTVERMEVRRHTPQLRKPSHGRSDPPASRLDSRPSPEHARWAIKNIVQIPGSLQQLTQIIGQESELVKKIAEVSYAFRSPPSPSLFLPLFFLRGTVPVVGGGVCPRMAESGRVAGSAPADPDPESGQTRPESGRVGLSRDSKPVPTVPWVGRCPPPESGRQGPTRLRVGRLRSESADSAIHECAWLQEVDMITIS
ncbi:hypothetical protein Taro_014720 [Colocasia esculenta]|uniref:Uncharacterized protein n=1 Tax=Colocasia esculenta TaxID=4460 RepID=A0A843UFD2_COLES|nr:hypothetical protein [Colocasia esculenta]